MLVQPHSRTVRRSARELCQAASEVYRTLFARLSETDPDAGFGATFASGSRALEWRVRAADWEVPEPAGRAAERLMRSAEEATGDEVADWISTFPRRLLQAMDRRGERDGDPSAGRRAADHRSIHAG